ncbi:MAG: response regulator [Christensenellales bacterium]|jgi:DNA-binding response OmpR family regulator|nr:response regulator transcription factor [Clostridiales bacterium]
MNQTIMVVDDDRSIAELLRVYLEKEGYITELYLRGDEALSAFKKNPPNLLLLDIMLPGMDGWEVLKQVRKISSVPIIMLSAKGETIDKVLGLELGADDYITKPFEPKELIARVKAVLRRAITLQQEDGSDHLTYPELTLSLKRYEVTYQGISIDMPPKELELLYFLALHPNQVFTREQLLEKVWGYDYFGDSRTIDVHVKRIREKLPQCEQYGWKIKTVFSVGYKFEVL